MQEARQLSGRTKAELHLGIYRLLLAIQYRAAGAFQHVAADALVVVNVGTPIGVSLDVGQLLKVKHRLACDALFLFLLLFLFLFHQ